MIYTPAGRNGHYSQLPRFHAARERMQAAMDALLERSAKGPHSRVIIRPARRRRDI